MKLEIEYTVALDADAEGSAELAKTMVENLGLLFRNCVVDTHVGHNGLDVVIAVELPKVHAALWEANRFKFMGVAMDGVEWEGVFADAPLFCVVDL